MLNKYNRYNLLKLFLDSPTEKDFEREGLIKKQIKRKIPFYTAIRDNPNFILYKKLSILFELNDIGLIDYLWDKLSPESIVLYGSFVKGESIEDSDIDLFILGKERKVDITKFEDKLDKKIHLFFKESLKEIPNELKNNILNGVILKGYLQVF
ncbi:nucleotidyltransferase domain-containing protein [Candidatus Pacearchaeota archaeon]|nr:nucleotidyltransferase domain-containing protein [Candidatus Pacearchaeota archaeon]